MVMHSLATKLKAIVHYTHFEASIRAVARKYGVSKSTIARWVHEDTQELTCQRGQHRRAPKPRACIRGAIQETIRTCLEQNPFVTAHELVDVVSSCNNVLVSLSTIARARKALGFRYKLASRSQTHQSTPPGHAFMSEQEVYKDAIALDESSFVNNDTPRRGWAQGSQHVPKPAPKNRQRVSLILAISRDGVVGRQLRTGSFNAQTFASFLQTLPANKRVIADNVSFHKSRCVKDVATERGQVLTYTPPYCPWFNPTEYAFSVTKNAYRKARWKGGHGFAGDVLRSVDNLDSSQCAAFFEHAENCVWNEYRKLC